MAAIDVTRRVEPGTVALLDHLARWDLTSIATIRSSYAAVGPAPVPADPRVRRTDEVIAGIDGRPDVRVRWYRPAAAGGALPCLVWLHGGAYIMGTLDENDDRLDRMVIELGCAVVSVDWRLAPEHPYPEGLDDADTVWRCVSAAAAGYGVDPARLVLGGASAGAGLAAALCLRLRETGSPQPVLQLLIYPMLDDRELTPSIRAIEEDPGHWGLWHLRANRMCWQAYLGPLAGGDVPATAAPARAPDLSGLAPAFLAIGDVDAYLGENLDYAARLSVAGVPTELHVYPGVIHGGFGARPRTPRTAQFLRDVYGALAAAFEPGEKGLWTWSGRSRSWLRARRSASSSTTTAGRWIAATTSSDTPSGMRTARPTTVPGSSRAQGAASSTRFPAAISGAPCTPIRSPRSASW